MVQAIIFDFDGVILDTEPWHCAAFVEVLPAIGVVLTEDLYYRRYVGLADREIVRRIGEDFSKALTPEAWAEVLARKSEAYRRLTDRGVEAIAGVDDLICRCARRWPLAICSGSRGAEILRLLRQVSLDGAFSVIVSADDLPASKPDPAGFLLTLRRLRERFGPIEARRCLVFEDSEAGVRAARGAGMKAVALARPGARVASATGDATIRGFSGFDDSQMDALIERLAP